MPGTYVKLRPQSKRFLDLTNPKATLETCLRNFSALTKGDTICITHGTNQYAIDIMELKPADQVTIIETDLNVDFAPPVDHEDGIMGAASKSARDEQAALAASSKAAATEPAPAPAPEPEPEGFAGHAFAGGSQAAAPKHDAFAGQGYSLSGKTAPKKGTEVTTYDKVASEWDQCKGASRRRRASSRPARYRYRNQLASWRGGRPALVLMPAVARAWPQAGSPRRLTRL